MKNDKKLYDDFIQMLLEGFQKLIRTASYDRSERATITDINTVEGVLEFTLQNAGSTNTYKVTQVNESVPTLIIGDTVIVRHIKNSGTNFYIDCRISQRV